jgi:hypothetical protein
VFPKSFPDHRCHCVSQAFHERDSQENREWPEQEWHEAGIDEIIACDSLGFKLLENHLCAQSGAKQKSLLSLISRNVSASMNMVANANPIVTMPKNASPFEVIPIGKTGAKASDMK